MHIGMYLRYVSYMYSTVDGVQGRVHVNKLFPERSIRHATYVYPWFDGIVSRKLNNTTNMLGYLFEIKMWRELTWGYSCLWVGGTCWTGIVWYSESVGMFPGGRGWVWKVILWGVEIGRAWKELEPSRTSCTACTACTSCVILVGCCFIFYPTSLVVLHVLSNGGCIYII